MSYLIGACTLPSTQLAPGVQKSFGSSPVDKEVTQHCPSLNVEHKKLCRVSYNPAIYHPPNVLRPAPFGCSTWSEWSDWSTGAKQRPAGSPTPSTDPQRRLSPLASSFGVRRRLETVESDPSFSAGSDDEDDEEEGKCGPDLGVFFHTATPTKEKVFHEDCQAMEIFGATKLAVDVPPFVKKFVAPNPRLFTAATQKNQPTDSVAVSLVPRPSTAVHSRNNFEFNKLCLQDSGYSTNSVPFADSPNFLPAATITSDQSTCKFFNFLTGDYENLKEFALKLGYNENQLRAVLQRFDGSADLAVGQDKILAELIKLGQDTAVTSTPASLPFDAPKPSLGSHRPAQPPADKLRAIVVDGSNVAITHGHKEVFSCKGIQKCVDWFRNRGHTDIKVFVPQFRKEASRSDAPITDQHLLFELEQQNVLVWTPSRRLNGRRIVCHDDKYVVKTASDKDAVIVSNDEYREIVKESPEYRRVVEERLLMYSFVDGNFMPPDDPLGRYGPKLQQFLRKGPCNSLAALCPYGRKCTYGNKCKFSHPERPNGLHRSVTDRLKDHAELHRRISPNHSLHVHNSDTNIFHAHDEACRSQSLSNQLYTTANNQNGPQHQIQSKSPPRNVKHTASQPFNVKHTASQPRNVKHTASQGNGRRFPATISHSVDLTKKGGWSSTIDRELLAKQFSNPENFNKNNLCCTPHSHPPSIANHNGLIENGFSTRPNLQPLWQHSNAHQQHPSAARNLSAPSLALRPTQHHTPFDVYHQPPNVLGGHNSLQFYGNFLAVGPGPNFCNPQPTPIRKNSISDSQLNLLGQKCDTVLGLGGTIFDGHDAVFDGSGHHAVNFIGHGSIFERRGTVPTEPDAVRNGSSDDWYVPSTTVWGPLENSSLPSLGARWDGACVSDSLRDPHQGETTAPTVSPAVYCRKMACNEDDNRRGHLFFHLSKLFPQDIVAKVMRSNAAEFNPHKLCQLILAETSGADA